MCAKQHAVQLYTDKEGNPEVVEIFPSKLICIGFIPIKINVYCKRTDYSNMSNNMVKHKTYSKIKAVNILHIGVL